MKVDILKTFEDFLREPLSILKKTIINITGIETDFTQDSSITVETTNEGIQINVINSKKRITFYQPLCIKDRQAS